MHICRKKLVRKYQINENILVYNKFTAETQVYFKGEINMSEIIKVYKEHFPSLRFIGICYDNPGKAWGEWFGKSLFKPLKELGEVSGIGNDFVGLMRTEPGFEYWTGMFFPADTAVPEGYDFIDLPESDIGKCWIKGNEETDNIFDCEKCLEAMKETGDFKRWSDGRKCHFQHYVSSRYNEKDEQGNVTLDYGVYLG